MNDNTIDLDQAEKAILNYEVADETLEAAAGVEQRLIGLLPCTGGPFLAATFGTQPC